ncbi:hypothetical protein GCM10009087_54040 [Sphingomonas oligophenolica]|uniref:OsmC family protein n=1 Tax=Sphingomonas oligophenolica TaxID=301154 RepID=A0ABU9YCQ4_9SPHN
MSENTPPIDAFAEAILVEETGAGRFQVEAHAGGSIFLVDEPVAFGGLGTGPNPYDLISMALGSCTAMTVRLYAERKQWPLDKVRVRVVHLRGTLKARDTFEREIDLRGGLDEEQRARLIDIAMRCPVHLTLERGADVRTTLAPPDVGTGPDEGGQHKRHMIEACEESLG